MSCKINPHIQEWIDIVENKTYAVCEEQELLVAYVQHCFETEDIYTDDDQLEKYISLARYFPFETLFPWQKFVVGLHDCTYWRKTGLPRWPDLFCELGRGAGKDGTIAWESICLMSPYNGIREYDVDICANNEDQAMRPVRDVIAAFERPAVMKKLQRFFYWTKEQVVSLKTQSLMKGRTNSPKGKDGLRSGICIFNEIHQYEDYANINVFTTGLGKKKHPRRSYYTTNGDVREGPLDDLLETAEGILRGGEPDNGLLPFICKLNKKEDVDQEENWPMANPSLPYLPDLMEEIRKGLDEPYKSLIPIFKEDDYFHLGFLCFSRDQDKYEEMELDWSNPQTVADALIPKEGSVSVVHNVAAVSVTDISQLHAGEEVVSEKQLAAEDFYTNPPELGQLGTGENRVEVMVGVTYRTETVEDKAYYDVFNSMHVTQIYAFTATKAASVSNSISLPVWVLEEGDTDYSPAPELSATFTPDTAVTVGEFNEYQGLAIDYYNPMVDAQLSEGYDI